MPLTLSSATYGRYNSSINNPAFTSKRGANRVSEMKREHSCSMNLTNKERSLPLEKNSFRAVKWQCLQLSSMQLRLRAAEITGGDRKESNSERRCKVFLEGRPISRNHREVVPTFEAQAGASVICVNRLLDSERDYCNRLGISGTAARNFGPRNFSNV